jgi:hypothetical protein
MEGAVSKGEFAAIIGVSPGRISQYLTEGKISSAALHGSGRNAKIIVEQAKADLRLTLDVAQRLGNGIETRLDADASDAGSPPVGQGGSRAAAGIKDPQQISGIDHEIKQQKLEQLRRANRNAALADAQASGSLIETDTSRAGMLRVASGMLLVFEGGLTDLASAIAAEFKLPQRDVLHLMRREFRKVRENAAKQVRAEAIELPETVETSIEAEEIETIN